MARCFKHSNESSVKGRELKITSAAASFLLRTLLHQFGCKPVGYIA
jgi:hypothetical protein